MEKTRNKHNTFKKEGKKSVKDTEVCEVTMLKK
jgi:hypothetical protein